jgi:hypothetical protein
MHSAGLGNTALFMPTYTQHTNTRQGWNSYTPRCPVLHLFDARALPRRHASAHTHAYIHTKQQAPCTAHLYDGQGPAQAVTALQEHLAIRQRALRGCRSSSN